MAAQSTTLAEFKLEEIYYIKKKTWKTVGTNRDSFAVAELSSDVDWRQSSASSEVQQSSAVNQRQNHIPRPCQRHG